MATAGTVVTAREAEVLALVGEHLTNAQIADQLCISVRTVDSHVAALLRKLQVPDRRALARKVAVDRTPGRGALPVPVTPFIGRVTEHAALKQLLAEHRLVTVVGPGGIGKTRLAINVAADVAKERRDGAWFVDLVRVTDPAAVVAAVAEAVGVSEHQVASSETALEVSLAPRDGLLVLDNCEHLLDGVCACVEPIIAECPGVTVLATSRSRLLLPYERLYSVPGLSVDENEGDAVALFLARVCEVTGAELPDAHRVGALCEALDGIALAIELAASRYATLGLDGLEAGLHERLRVLTVGGPAAGRHRSLRGTIDWSYGLLSAADQELLRGVAVFASWFDVDAARAVAAPAADRSRVANELSRLADHSLLVVERGAPTRYRALETIREYSGEKLEAAGELAAVHARHERWCRAALTELAAAQPDDAWCVRFDRIVDDARATLLRCAADPERGADAAHLAAHLAGQLWLRGRLTEAQHRYEQAAELSPSPPDRVDYLRMAAGAASTGFGGIDLLRLLRAAADLSISIGDTEGAAHDLAWMSLFITRAPGIMAEPRTDAEAAALLAEATALSDGSAWVEAATAVATAFGDYRHLSVERAEDAVAKARRVGDRTMEDAALDLLTALHLKLDDLPAAVDTVRRRDELVRDLPMAPVNGFEHGDHCLYGSEVLLAAGDLPGAAAYADRLASLPFNRGDDYLGLSRRLKVDALAGHFDAVLRDAEGFRLSWERVGRPVVPNLGGSAYAVSMVYGILGDGAARARWTQLTKDLIGGQDSPSAAAYMPTFDAIVALHWGDPVVALDHLVVDLEDSATWWHGGQMVYRPWYAALWAEAAVLAQRDDASDRIDPARYAARNNPVALAMVERTAAFATGDGNTVESLAPTFEALGCRYQQERTGVLAAMLLP